MAKRILVFYFVIFLYQLIAVGVYALKSANRVLNKDVVGTFFVVLNSIRGPPIYQFEIKNFELIGGINMATMPKRRKSKDNPYNLEYNDIDRIYIVSFKDNKQEKHDVEVSKSIFDAFNKFELEDISQLHKKDKHIDNRRLNGIDDFSEIVLYHNSISSSKTLEEEVEERVLFAEIKEAMNSLNETQKRRIKKYFFEDKTYEEIAKEENCTKMAVKFSIDIGIEKISKKFKN